MEYIISWISALLLFAPVGSRAARERQRDGTNSSFSPYIRLFVVFIIKLCIHDSEGDARVRYELHTFLFLLSPPRPFSLSLRAPAHGQRARKQTIDDARTYSFDARNSYPKNIFQTSRKH